MVPLFALLGVCAGGLVNQLGTALSQGQRLTLPRCGPCGQRRPWWQWSSLLAVLIGRGRCHACAAPINLRHPLVELGLAALYAYLGMTAEPPVRLALHLLYTAVLVLVLITDIEVRRIPNAVLLPAITLATLAGLVTPGMAWWQALAGGAVGSAFFFLTAALSKAALRRRALGAGDVKLATFIGLISGFPLVFEAIAITILLAGVSALVLTITRVRRLGERVPYGPFFVAGAMVALLWGQQIAGWLLR